MIASWQEINDKKKKKKKACWKAKKQNIACQKGLDSQGYGLSSSHIWLWELNHKEIRVLKNWCLRTVVLEKTLESSLDSKESNQSILEKKNTEYSLEGLMLKLKWGSNILVTWCEQLTHWKRPWCWEKLKAEGEEGDRSWDGWMASLIQCTWTWANSGRWWGTEKPGVWQSMGLWRVRRD